MGILTPLPCLVLSRRRDVTVPPENQPPVSTEDDTGALVRERTLVNRAHPSRASNRPSPARTDGRGFFSSLGNLFRRRIEDDMVVLGDGWLKDSGVQRQLEFEGFQLRWVTTNKVDVNIADGWQYVTLSYRLWWLRRVRRRHGAQHQYLLKKARSFRSQNDS